MRAKWRKKRVRRLKRKRRKMRARSWVSLSDHFRKVPQCSSVLINCIANKQLAPSSSVPLIEAHVWTLNTPIDDPMDNPFFVSRLSTNKLPVRIRFPPIEESAVARRNPRSNNIRFPIIIQFSRIPTTSFVLLPGMGWVDTHFMLNLERRLCWVEGWRLIPRDQSWARYWGFCSTTMLNFKIYDPWIRSRTGAMERFLPRVYNQKLELARRSLVSIAMLADESMTL